MHKPRVICVGVNPAFDITLSLDGLDDDRVNRVTEERRQAAGKAANVACVLASMGVDTALTGCYGRDTYPEWQSLFEKRTGNVELLPVMCPGATRQNITLLCDGRTVKINRAGDGIEPDGSSRAAENISLWAKPGDTAVFTGSIPPGMTHKEYLSIIRDTASKGVRVAVDTDALTEEELLSVKPWLYKPNAYELAKLCNADPENDGQLVSQAQRLAREGIEVVLLTLGSRGLAAVTAQQTVRLPASKVKAVNTVGAGDAALAAFVGTYLLQQPLAVCAEAAAKAGEKSVMNAF